MDWREVDLEVLEAIPEPTRTMAPFMWPGGKGAIAKWVVSHLPRNATVYVEPYAGAASVLWHLPEPYPVEVLNDLDQRIVNLFRVLQDREKFEELQHRLVWTPYSRTEFVRALEILDAWEEYDEVSRAWAFFVAQNQGFGGKANNDSDWGRVMNKISRGMAGTAASWRSRLKSLTWWHDRLTRVQIDNRDALEVIRYWDTPETLFYLDPPYVLETRQGGELYRHEASMEHHEALVQTLLGIKGQAVLSGYDHPVYRPLEEAGWRKVSRETASHLAGRIRGSRLQGKGAALQHARRVECLWIKVHDGGHLP